MKQYKTLIIYTISNDQSKKSFEEELEKYGLERVGEQGIFALPLEEYRTKVFTVVTGVRFSQGSPLIRAFSSVGQSGRLITDWSGVRVPEGPPTFLNNMVR